MRNFKKGALALTLIFSASAIFAQDAVTVLNDRRAKVAECLAALEAGADNVSTQLVNEVAGFTRIFSED